MSSSQRLDYFRAYAKSDKGRASQKRYRQSKKGKIIRKRYDQSPKGKINHRKGNIRHCILYPKRIKARSVVNCAVVMGKLPRAKTLKCHYGEHPAEQYHHWHGYEPKHWLDIIPVCQDCHKKYKRRIA